MCFIFWGTGSWKKLWKSPAYSKRRQAKDLLWDSDPGHFPWISDCLFALLPSVKLEVWSNRIAAWRVSVCLTSTAFKKKSSMVQIENFSLNEDVPTYSLNWWPIYWSDWHFSQCWHLLLNIAILIVIQRRNSICFLSHPFYNWKKIHFVFRFYWENHTHCDLKGYLCLTADKMWLWKTFLFNL